MRKEMGWEAAVNLLRLRDDEPIVTSYSVCEQFPAESLIDPALLPKDDDGEPYWDGSTNDLWDLAMAALRAKKGALELRPDDFDTFFFRVNVSCLDIYQKLWRKPVQPHVIVPT